jgi:predicted nucleic acid-binding protein
VRLFLDTSALVKRYVEEAGSPRVEALLLQASALGVSVLAAPEAVSALCRLRRERRLTAAQYARAKMSLFEDLVDAGIVDLDESVVVRSVELLERWPIRSADALHLASALEWQVDTFATADDRQAAAARGAGVNVELVSAD